MKIKPCGILKSTLSLTGIILLSFPSTAYAYLDPGTGNILAYLVIGLFGAIAYSLKNVFWSIFGKKPKGDQAIDHEAISIFSEGRNYWNTFKPIVTALIDMEQPFSYYSMDIHDPGLAIHNRFMRSKYVGKEGAAFARIEHARSKVMLSTTPNIGAPGFPLKRPKHVDVLVHVCHSVDAVPWYKKGSLDNYDAVMLTGDFMEAGIRCLERARGLKEKDLIPAGLPYLDELKSNMSDPLPPTDGKTVLIAPSWGEKGCLSTYGESFIKNLAQAGFNVILRPHPQSWKSEKEMLDGIKKATESFSNVEWDTAPDGSPSFERADILISDTSNVRFDFALLYERPVITLKIPLSDLGTFEISDMESIWSSEAELIIGSIVTEDQIADIAPIVRNILANSTKKNLETFRNASIHNFGSSGKTIAEYMTGLVSIPR
jgi:hypothetical protein